MAPPVVTMRIRPGSVPLLVWGMALMCFAQPRPLSPRFERISVNDGLSQSTIRSIIQDRFGIMWFGSRDGLNRYDGYRFKVFKHDAVNPQTLSDNNIMALFEDAEGRLWVGTKSGGLNLYQRETGTFRSWRYDPERPDSLPHDTVQAVIGDGAGGLWLGTDGGGVCRFDTASGTVRRLPFGQDDGSGMGGRGVWDLETSADGVLWIATDGAGLDRYDPGIHQFQHFRHDPERPDSLSYNIVMNVLCTTDGLVLVGTYGGGLDLFDPTRENFVHYRHDPDDPDSLSSNYVYALYEDRSGRLWVGTIGGGLCRFDPVTGRFRTMRHRQGDPFSLSHDQVWSIYEDRGGVFWIGTKGDGLNRFDSQRKRFLHVRHDPGSSEGLTNNRVSAFAADGDGGIWVGTRGGGLNHFDPDSGAFRAWRHRENDPNSLAHDEVRSLLYDPHGFLWIGSDRGLSRFEPDVEMFRHFRSGGDSGKVLAHDRVRPLVMDHQGVLWIGTNGGLNAMDTETETFRLFRGEPDKDTGLCHDEVMSLLLDPGGSLWIGTENGLNRFDRESRFERFPIDPVGGRGLSHGRIFCLYMDGRGRLWAGTAGGLNMLDPHLGEYTHYRERDGLPNEVILGLVGDDQGKLWLSTNEGLVRFDPDTAGMRVYDVGDGLQSDEFSVGGYFKAPSGRVYFGGINGFNSFDPAEIQENTYTPPIAVTRIQLFNQPIQRTSSRGVFDEAGGALHLSHLDAVISFSFAALHYAQPAKNRYAYKLEGFDRDWVQVGSDNRQATYTNLDPGRYVFKVKGANSDGVWNPEPVAVTLRVDPPIWATWWAWLAYGLLASLLIFGYVRGKERELAGRAEMIRRLEEIDRLKDEFLANTSHELRTPLNGIIGLTESLLDGAAGPVSGKLKSDLGMVAASGKRLAGMVNDLLDFSKLKNDELTLNKGAVDLHALVDVVLPLYQPRLKGGAVHLCNEVNPELPAVEADEERLQQILHHLLENAVKFTAAGVIRIFAEQQDKRITVHVEDTGVGIRPEVRERLFEGFERGEGVDGRTHSGAGLGLPITKRLVHLHGGHIDVVSEPGRGARVSFSLPVSTAPKPRTAYQVQDRIPEIEAPTRHADRTGEAGLKGLFKILIVDDEPINRQVLENYLDPRHYDVVHASGGEEALRLADREDFDLVLLDIMMPRMSGYEVCRRLRRRFPIHELPIIFLTAKSHLNHLVTGFQVGSNDYLTKPVSKAELLTRVETHLALLDVNRGLERVVAQRTSELETKTILLENQNRELTTLDDIITVINREVALDALLQAMLDEGLVLFPNAESGVVLVWDIESGGYRPVATHGGDIPADLLVPHDVAVFQDAGDWPFGIRINPSASPEDVLPGKPVKASILLHLEAGDAPEAFLILLNHGDPDAFDHVSRATIRRFREHVVTAMGKAGFVKRLLNTTEELKKTQYKLLDAAHEAGRADMAVNLLHGVGNHLNSINASAGMVVQKLDRPRPLQLLKRVVELLNTHRQDLAAFFDTDPGRMVPETLARISDGLDRLCLEVIEETIALQKGLAEVNTVVLEQDMKQGPGGLSPPMDPAQFLEELLKPELNFYRIHKIRLETDWVRGMTLRTQAHKLGRTLNRLLTNARESLRVKAGERRLRLVIGQAGDTVVITVMDNGEVAPLDCHKLLFTQGFHKKSTLKHAVGLHQCANAIGELGGEIGAQTELPAGFTIGLEIRLPMGDDPAVAKVKT